ncbi:acyl-CoA thioesterase II [Ammonicoccus fulvus]|uniref:Acyl-CoA thioesterase II n=1 Tax=Ammonicoccus fulvus TaxID=3138240 RepID=A0ABZ3FPF9_9ACTN
MTLLSPIDELLTLLDLEEIEVGLFRGRHPSTKRQRTFGGQVLAQSLMAASHSVPEDRTAHSMHAYFLRPGRTDAPMIFDVETLRDGRSFSSRRVLARQDGHVILGLTASFHIREPGLEHSDAMPDVPAAEDCPRMSEIMSERSGAPAELWESAFGGYDVRWVGSSGPDGTIPATAHGAHARIWVRANSGLPDNRHLHAAVLAYLSDLTLLGVSTVPHSPVFDERRFQAASIDHAMWFHRPVRADEWWLYDQISPIAIGGLGMSTSRIFQHGRMVASATQEGLIRPVENNRADQG